ncbi:MAG: L-serine ammonia-lyase, iron-sulfur-dependent, subunit alpha, partial [Clostridiaceae bacterium]|nr:L-serine ammonia-lyase, iron-sulfur-dependent, subunit alpha [Clostridiaceae bacterium]
SDFGLGVGKMMHNSIKKGLLKEDISSYAVSLTAAATDARMAGCMLPVMSTAGSGNQGITATMPVVAVAEKLNISREKLIRAIALSNLITIHIKSFIGRLSALCGCGVAASIGASCGITYIMGGNLESINCAIKNMIANVSGIICDGAKSGCALKIATAVSGAVQCAILAVNGTETSYRGGIVDKSIDKTIRNLDDIGNEGMEETDKVILGIMAGK